MKKNKYAKICNIILCLVIIIIFSSYVIAKPNPGHTADQVSGGTFDDGDGGFVFPAVDVTMDTSTFHVDSSNSRVGIGILTPSYLFHVNGNSYLTGISYFGDTGSYFDTSGNLLLAQATNIELDSSSTRIWASADATENLWMTSAGDIFFDPGYDVSVSDDDMLLITGGICASDSGSCSDPGDGNLVAYQDIYVGYGDGSDDDYIYFDGNTIEYFGIDESADTYLLSGHISIGADSNSDDDHLYFDSSTSSFLEWDNSLSRFSVSHDLYVGSSSSNDDDYLRFDDGSSYLFWDNNENSFSLTYSYINFYSVASDPNISILSDIDATLTLSSDISGKDSLVNPIIVFQKNGGNTIATMGGEGTSNTLFYINSTDNTIIAPGLGDYVNIKSTSTPLRVQSSLKGNHDIMDICSTDLNTDDEYARISFRTGSDCSTEAAGISFLMEDVTSSTEDSEIVFETMAAGAAVSEAGRFTNNNGLTVENNLYVGYSSNSDNDWIYFDALVEYIEWVNSPGRYVFSDDLYTAGNITVASLYNFEIADGTAYVCSGGCNPENIDYGSLDGELFVESDIESEGYLYADYIRSMGHMYINYNGPDADSGLYFYDSSSSTGESIRWDNTGDRFYIYDDVFVGASLDKSSGSFLIDHPLDPYNKILRHSFSESPEMLNVYKGNSVTINKQKTITMPDWFVPLNGNNKDDYSFSIGSLNNACGDNYVDNSNIAVDGTFTIHTEYNCEFSWAVYGVRHDAFALENPFIIEESKISAGFPTDILLKDLHDEDL